MHVEGLGREDLIEPGGIDEGGCVLAGQPQVDGNVRAEEIFEQGTHPFACRVDVDRRRAVLLYPAKGHQIDDESLGPVDRRLGFGQVVLAVDVQVAPSEPPDAHEERGEVLLK